MMSVKDEIRIGQTLQVRKLMFVDISDASSSEHSACKIGWVWISQVQENLIIQHISVTLTVVKKIALLANSVSHLALIEIILLPVWV